MIEFFYLRNKKGKILKDLFQTVSINLNIFKHEQFEQDKANLLR